MNYEQAVNWLQAQPEYAKLVHQSYLDKDVLACAQRFAVSEEMAEVARLFRLTPASRLTIADIGCGNGIAAYAMAQMGNDVIGIVPTPANRSDWGQSQRSTRKPKDPSEPCKVL